MLCGLAGPFRVDSMPNLIHDIENVSGDNLKFPAGVDLSDECKDLLRGLLQKDPENRLNWWDFFHHKVFPVILFLFKKNRQTKLKLEF